MIAQELLSQEIEVLLGYVFVSKSSHGLCRSKRWFKEAAPQAPKLRKSIQDRACEPRDGNYFFPLGLLMAFG